VLRTLITPKVGRKVWIWVGDKILSPLKNSNIKGRGIEE